MDAATIFASASSSLALAATATKLWIDWRRDKREAVAERRRLLSEDAAATAQTSRDRADLVRVVQDISERRLRAMHDALEELRGEIAQLREERDHAEAEARLVKRRCAALELALIRAGLDIPD